MQLIVALMCATQATSCGRTDAVVTVSAGDGMPIAQLPVQLLPFDRAAVLDSMARAYPLPQPVLPAAAAAMQDSVKAAQARWTSLEAQWNAARDSITAARAQVERLRREDAEYAAMYNRWQALEHVVNRADADRQRAFRGFDSAQVRYSAWADSLRTARRAWSASAYADSALVFGAHARAAGRSMLADTTDDGGTVTFSGVKRGTYWIHARHDLPFEELYWNIRIDAGGDPVQVQLNRSTAQMRPKL